jgi:hypothetical protein
MKLLLSLLLFQFVTLALPAGDLSSSGTVKVSKKPAAAITHRFRQTFVDVVAHNTVAYKTITAHALK